VIDDENEPGFTEHPHELPGLAQASDSTTADAPSVLRDDSALRDVLSAAGAGATTLRGSALRAIGYAIGALAAAGGAALLFRHLGVVDTGRYVTGMALVSIVAATSDLGLTAVGIREMATRSGNARSAVARDLLGLRITLTTVGSLIVVAIALLGYTPLFAAGVGLGCVGLLLQAIQDNFTLPLLVTLRFGVVAVLDMTRQLLILVCTAALVVVGARLLPFFGMTIPVGIVLVLIVGSFVRGTRTLTPTFNWKRWRSLVASILPYSVAVAAYALYFRVSVLLVSAFSSAKQLGYFSASFRVIEFLTMMPSVLVGSCLPIFAKSAQDDTDRFAKAVARVFEVATIVGCWVCISIVAVAPLAISLLGGASYRPASKVLAIQGIALGATFVDYVWGFALLSMQKYSWILVLNTGALVANVAFVAPLASANGAVGAALGTAAVEVLLAFGGATVVRRQGVALRSTARTLLRVGLCSVVALVPALINGVFPIWRLMMSTVVFGLALLVTRTIPVELLELVPSSRLRRALQRFSREVT
jgi:O-antigen/teichoic acid export membrane protein